VSLLPVEDALDRLLSRAKPVLETETVLLASADGRILGEDVTARLTQPPFKSSAMDGYALRAEDAPQLGSVLTVIGTASAGHAFDGTVGKGEAVRIFTGAPVPEGADTILIQEDADLLDNDQIRSTFEVVRDRHIRPKGQDFMEGEVVLQKDRLLSFADVTVAAGMNHAELRVYRKPLVAILATGDELVQPGSVPKSDQIIASNTFGVAAIARNAGAEVLDLGIISDDKELIGKAIERAITAKADVLVTLGGASVGDHDLVQASLKAKGMELDFWRIAMRPGKPLMVGAIDTMQVLGLPGNPVASLVCSLLFLEPLVQKLARTPSRRREVQAVTETDLKANDHRQDYMRATLTIRDDGTLVAKSFDKQDSSMMKTLANSHALIVRPPNAPPLKAGDPCPIILLRI